MTCNIQTKQNSAIIYLDQLAEWPGYRQNGQGIVVQFPIWTRNSNQTDSKANPGSNLMGVGDSFPGGSAGKQFLLDRVVVVW
jgi:hypothetical protein